MLAIIPIIEGVPGKPIPVHSEAELLAEHERQRHSGAARYILRSPKLHSAGHPDAEQTISTARDFGRLRELWQRHQGCGTL